MDIRLGYIVNSGIGSHSLDPTSGLAGGEGEGGGGGGGVICTVIVAENSGPCCLPWH